MKKIILTGVIAFFAAITMNAQTELPTDCNAGVLQGAVNQCEGQDWTLANVGIAVIDYLVMPEPPYASGFVTMSFVPDCDPGEPCPRIAKVVNYERIVINNNGACKYERADF